MVRPRPPIFARRQTHRVRLLLRAAGAILIVVPGVTIPSRPCVADLVSPFPSYATGASPQALAVGDLNGDGYPDVVTTNYSPGGVSVLLADGAGGFGANADLATGAEARNVALTDLDGDGHLDLLVVNYAPRTLSILLGHGDGTFGPKADYVCSAGPQAIAVGDLNGDGWPDVTVANLQSTTVSVFLGTGTGSMGARSDWGVGIGPRSHVVRDVNGDGRLDIVTANSGSGTVSVLQGDGAGRFGGRADYVTGSGPRAVAPGDFNGDGRLDLAVPNSNSNSVSILLQKPTGGFAPRVDYFVGGSPQHAAIADFTADGKLDLAVVRSLLNTVSILPGHGDGTFGAPADYATGSSPQWAVAAMLDGNGSADLVVANSASNSVSVGLNGSASPRIAVSPEPLNFGVKYVGHADSLVLRVSNSGSATLEVSAMTLSGPEFSLAGPTAFSLVSGDHRDVPIIYPRATAGNDNGTLTIASNDATSPSRLVSVSGTSLALPMPSVNPDTLRLTAVSGSTTSGSLVLANGGLGSLSYGVSVLGVAPAWLTWSPVSGALGLGESATVTVHASAASLYAGFSAATLRLTTNDPAGTKFDVPVLFTVTGQSAIAVTPAALDFGQGFAGYPDTLKFQVRNAGAALLTVSTIAVSGEFELVGATEFALPPAASRELSIRNPRITVGTANETLTIESDGASSPTLVPLAGLTVDPPVIVVAPASIVVDLQFGQNTTVPLVIRNDGGSDLTFHTPAGETEGSVPYLSNKPRQDLSALLPITPVTAGVGASPWQETETLGSEVVQALSNGSRTLVLATNSIDQTIGRALNELNQSYDYLFTWDFTTVDFSPYARIIVGMDGGTLGAASVQALAGAVGEGRRLIVFGGTNWPTYYDGLQTYLLKHTGVKGWGDSQSPHLRVVNPADPLAIGLPSLKNFAHYGCASYMVRISDPAAKVVAVNGDGYPILIHKQIGTGELVYYTPTPRNIYWPIDSDYAVFKRILDNALGLPVPWLTALPESGVVSAHTSTVLQVRADAAQLADGSHVAELHLYGNDPARPEVVVPVQLDVHGATAVALSLTRSDVGPERVALEWYSGERNLPLTLYRRNADSDWARLCDLAADGTGRVTYEDLAIVAGGRYGYRLGVMEAHAEHYYGEVWIDVPRPVLALYGASPNPATAELRVSFSLPSHSAADLEVFDVRGRLIASRRVGDLGAGRHLLSLGDTRRVEPGVYFLRLSAEGRRLTVKAAVVN